MGHENSITKAISAQLKAQLKNPLLKVLKEIKAESLLRQSHFVKKESVSSSSILLHFVSMIVMNKSIGSFAKYASQSYKKDVYCRMLKNRSYQWQKLLLQSAVALISKVATLHKPRLCNRTP